MKRSRSLSNSAQGQKRINVNAYEIDYKTDSKSEPRARFLIVLVRNVMGHLFANRLILRNRSFRSP